MCVWMMCIQKSWNQRPVWTLTPLLLAVSVAFPSHGFAPTARGFLDSGTSFFSPLLSIREKTFLVGWYRERGACACRTRMTGQRDTNSAEVCAILIVPKVGSISS